MSGRFASGWIGMGLVILCGCEYSQALKAQAARQQEAAALAAQAADQAAASRARSVAEREAAETTAAQANANRSTPQNAVAGSNPQKRLALLVGCTEYLHEAIPDLEGPGHDIELTRKLLMERYNFREQDITTLADGAGHAKLPTLANIRSELKDLEEAAGKGVQIFLQFSGHGTQQPDLKPDPKNDPEPDGMDEVFLPKDAGGWESNENGLPNVLVDDELRSILARITAKGADVWAVFDCCCSGTIARDASLSANPERKREVSPKDLIPTAALQKAEEAAFAAYGASRDIVQRDKAALDAGRPATADAEAGGFVATYAALPNQPTVELAFPRNEMPANQTKYGLLTYTLYSILSQAATNLTYTELEQEINAQYARWGRTAPTSLVEGTLADRFVLADQGEGRITRILLDKAPDGTFWINAGSLQGLTVGTILKVSPPARAKDADTLLGAVQVTSLQALRSQVEPAAYEAERLAKADPSKLQSKCRAEIVYLDYGIRKKKIAFASDAASELAGKAARPALLTAASVKGSLIELADSPQHADWVVRVADGKPYLHHAASLEVNCPTGQDCNLPPALDAFGPPLEGEDLAQWVQTSMQKIARVESLLAMTSSQQTVRSGGAGVNVTVETIKYKDASDQKGELLREADAVFKAGDNVDVRITNRGRDAVDITLLYIDSDFGITALYPEPGTKTDNTLTSGQSYTEPLSVEGEQTGVERVVVIAVKHQDQAVDFTWLAQPTIDKERKKGAGEAATPLDELLESSLYGEGNAKGVRRRDLGDYTIRAISWTIGGQ